MSLTLLAKEAAFFSKVCGLEKSRKKHTAGTIKRDRNSVKKMLREEFKELLTAKTTDDILDGSIDVLYVLLQLINKLQEAGIDVEEALRRVNQNNSSKYTDDYEKACLWEAEAEGSGLYLESNLVDGVEYYCLKNEDGKVSKPYDFVKVDFSDLIPENLK